MKTLRPSEIKAKAEEMGISFNSAVRMRIRYLLEQIEKWEAYIDEKTDEIPWGTIIGHFDELCRLKEYEHMLAAGTLAKSEITDEMIKRAKEFPIEQLIEFQKGVALAWCHSDKHPSLTWHKKKNQARCFPCDKSFNSIDVCMDRDKMSFLDAVKSLQ